ncbi:hypothetical protein [Intestinimonas butyriciproducens]|uniref:hypothetical protein n=1 Tax=Intestinimonas butyriciproducens TaxID=1297617 RepID=UPI0034A2F0CD
MDVSKGLSKGLSYRLKGLRQSQNKSQQGTTKKNRETIVPQWFKWINYDKRKQAIKRSNVIGKDEVPSSNLGSSSRKPLFSIEKSGFLFEKAITKSW